VNKRFELFTVVFSEIPLVGQTGKTACGSTADLRVMFAFFSNRLGCIGSLTVSLLGSLLLILVLRSCGAF
jgi:hypothetical protein